MTNRRKGISLRAYAKRRGVTERAIRKLRDAGQLATYHDGTVNEARSDALLASSKTRGANTSPTLASARRRKLAAQVRTLGDVVTDLRGGLIGRRDAAQVYRETAAPVARRLLRIAADAAGQVAGRPAAEAAALLRDAVNDALIELTGDEGDPEPKPRRRREPSLERLGEVRLQTRKTALAAEALELRRAARLGQMIRADAVAEEAADRFTNCRGRVLSMPGQVSHQVEHADAAEAERLIRAAIADAVEGLAWADLRVTAAQLMPRRRRTRVR